jgi:small subunit ribosomal protein S11
MATTIRQASHAQRSIFLPIRTFSYTCRQHADESRPNPPQSVAGTPSDPETPSQPTPSPTPGAQHTSSALRNPVLGTFSRQSTQPSNFSSLADLSASLAGSRTPLSGQQLVQDTLARARNQPTTQEILDSSSDDLIDEENWTQYEEPFHFHVYGHKHNTHITVTKPNRNTIITASTGQLGFRKSKRGSYDAAYQLCAFVIDKLNQGNWHKKIHKLEVVLRGFGNAREAATKVLLGNEGKFLRPKIVLVSDATRLKFGGTRSKGPRRLG